MTDSKTKNRGEEALTVEAMTAALIALGVEAGDVIMPHVSLRRTGLSKVPGGAERLIEALERAVGPEGTLLMILGTESPHEDVNLLPVEERAEALRGREPLVLATAPVLAEVGTFAEVFRRTPGTLQSDNPSGRFGARGAKARELLEGQPLDDYYGPGSPLERLVELEGKVLRLGSDPDTVTLLHYSEYLAQIDKKRRTQWDYLLQTQDGPRHVVIRCLDDNLGIVDWDGEDYFGLAIQDYDAAGHGQYGTLGSAPAALYDAPHLARSGARWMERQFKDKGLGTS